MKTSKKILFVVAGLVLVYMVVALVILRNDVNRQLKNKYANYKELAIENFEKLDFSANWDVNIKQGNEYRVELDTEENDTFKSKLQNIDGTLYFTVVNSNEKKHKRSIQANITMPSLKAIKAAQGTIIHLENFQSDSLSVIMESGGVFTGDNNHFKYISFKASGDTLFK